MRTKSFYMSTILVLLVSSVSVLYAEDFVTVDGKVYKNATVAQHNPAGIVIENQDGVFQILFKDLPEATRKKYNYDPKKADEFQKMRQKNVSEWNKERSDEVEKEKKGEKDVIDKVDASLREDRDREQQNLNNISPVQTDDQDQDQYQNQNQSQNNQNNNDDNNVYYGGGGYGYNYPYGYGYWNNHHYCPFYHHQGGQGTYSGYKQGASPHNFGSGFHSGGASGFHGGGGGGHGGGGGGRR